MAAPNPIRIDGLREFSRNLRKMDKDLPKGLKAASNVAAEIVVGAARPRVPIGPGKRGHARDSLKAASTTKAARVSAGGKKFPYYAWLDFGGVTGRNGSAKRPFLKSGRYIWKAFEDHREDVIDTLAEELANVARNAGVEVSD